MITAGILEISQGILFAVCDSRPVLLNLKNKTIKDLDQIEILFKFEIWAIQETPNKVFICLVSPTKFEGTSMEKLANMLQLNPYKLVQFTIDPKKEELQILKATKTDHSFNRLSRIENSNYFLAEGYNPSNISEIFLLLIEKDQVEIIRVISGLANPYGSFTMMKNESMIIRKEGRVISFHKYSIKRKEKKSPDMEGDRPKITAEEMIDPLLSYLP